MTDQLHTQPRAERQLPPFAALYDDPRPGAWCPAHEVLTPRNAAQLWAAAVSLAHRLDVHLDDARLPVWPCDSEWARMPWIVEHGDTDWFGQFVDSVVDLADDLAAGRCPIPRCTAEEMALQLVIEDVCDPHERGVAELITAVVRGLPVREWDQEWDDVAASLFPDPKVRRLVADRFGGHVDDYELVAETGLARLAPHRWFDPIDDTRERPRAACDCGDLP